MNRIDRLKSITVR